MLVAEIFKSVQGEGSLSGTSSVFVRTSGCNLRCRFCDTPYASWEPEGEERTAASVAQQVLDWTDRHVVITGGEPMLQPELVDLCSQLHAAGRHITIETAGTVDQQVICDLMSISPKLSNSTPTLPRASQAWIARHEQRRHAPAVMQRLLSDYHYQIKFVVESPADIAEVIAYLQQFPQVDQRQVMLMPQALDAGTQSERAAWLVQLCATHQWTYCPRRQLDWFGLQRGT